MESFVIYSFLIDINSFFRYTKIMENIFKPIYTDKSDAITTSYLPNGNRYASSTAGFNWRNAEFPHLHNHTHWEFLLVVNGNIQHTINGKKYTVHKGYVCLIRPSDIHKFIFVDKKSETLTFGFSHSVAEKLLAAHPSLKDIRNHKRPLSFNLNNDTFDAIISKTLACQFFSQEIYEQYTILIVNRLLLAYIEQKLNKEDAYPDWLNNFLIYLRNPENLKQTIPEIAKHSNYSYQHLSKLFKKYLGKTLIEYIQDLKITLAKESLLYTNKSVSEIALDLNYESTATLNHLFKKATGFTPLEFRKNSSSTP